MTTLVERDTADNEQDLVIPSELKNKKIICRVWSDTGANNTPVVLSKRKIKYGQPTFNARIGGKDRLYKVNYRTKGLIKQEGKLMYYDTHFLNSVGGLAFHEFQEDIDSEEAYTVFKNNAVNMYVKKGGIPAILLYITFIAMIILAVSLAYVSPTTIGQQSTIEQLDAQVTTLKQQNALLQQQVTILSGGSQIG